MARVHEGLLVQSEGRQKNVVTILELLDDGIDRMRPRMGLPGSRYRLPGDDPGDAREHAVCHEEKAVLLELTSDPLQTHARILPGSSSPRLFAPPLPMFELVSPRTWKLDLSLVPIPS